MRAGFLIIDAFHRPVRAPDGRSVPPSAAQRRFHFSTTRNSNGRRSIGSRGWLAISKQTRGSPHRADHVPEVALLLRLPVLHLPEVVVLLLGEPVLAVALLNGGGDTVILRRRLCVC